MFTKPIKSPTAETAPAAAVSRKPVIASLVAPGVRIRGDLVTDGDLHLDGAVEGDLRAGALTIGETGSVNGTIEADSVEVRGRVAGSITAREVRLHATAHVEGDITHAELAIDAGARFEGRSLRLPTPVTLEPVVLAAAE